MRDALSNLMLLRLLREGGDEGHRHPQCCEYLCHNKDCIMRYGYCQVYSVLGLLMVGTFNLEKDRLLERQITGWPGPTSGNPSFHGVVDPNLGNLDGHIMKEQLEYREYDMHTSLSNEELKKYEKQKSKRQ